MNATVFGNQADEVGILPAQTNDSIAILSALMPGILTRSLQQLSNVAGWRRDNHHTMRKAMLTQFEDHASCLYRETQLPTFVADDRRP